ncbi:hypothetical protein CI102_6979 [Trichoderma harzianum]|nr:hypothetical protein CI102_6979 [Trichoderma harzianum]
MSRLLHAPHPATVHAQQPCHYRFHPKLYLFMPYFPLHKAVYLPHRHKYPPSQHCKQAPKKGASEPNLNPWRVHASVGTSPANLLVRSRFSYQLSLSSTQRNHPRSFIIFARFLSIRRHKLILQLFNLPFN